LGKHPLLWESNAKDCSNYHTIALISHANKGMLKILQVRLQQYVNHELPDVQAGFRKGRGTRFGIIWRWKVYIRERHNRLGGIMPTWVKEDIVSEGRKNVT